MGKGLMCYHSGYRVAGMMGGGLSVSSLACINDRLLPWTVAHGTVNG